MNKRLQALLQRKAAAVGKMKDITAAAGENVFTEEQTAAFAAAKQEAEQLDVAIQQTRDAIEAERALGGVDVQDASSIIVGGQRGAEDRRHGFASLGEFAAVAFQAQMRGMRDDRLQIGAAATTYGSEGNLADGGFLVPPEFSSALWTHSLEEDAFLPLTDGLPVSGNSISFPKDETTPWGSDGVRAYWEAEAAVATQTKPKGSVNTLRMNKLIALVPVTDELQADAGALGGYLAGKAAESIRWKTNLALFAGTGAGQPEGVFVSSARVDVAKETSQTADTVNAANVAKMYARQIKPTRAVWLINPQVLPQLMVMTIGNQPIWTPPSEGFKNAPMGLLLGRPIYSTQMSKQVGDVGDIGFVDFKHVRSITKAGGIETATSMHLYFDQAMNAFRFLFRVDAKPVIDAAVSPLNGTDTLSPFVFLADRA
jgi:HK97 family phage major capsid protein